LLKWQAVWLGALVLILAPGCSKKKKEVPKVEALPSQTDAGLLTPTGDATGPRSGSGASGASGATLASPKLEATNNTTRESARLLPINGRVMGKLTSPSKQPITRRRKGSPPVPLAAHWYILELSGTQSHRVQIQLTPEDTSNLVLEWLATTDTQYPSVQSGAVLAHINNGGKSEPEIFPATLLPPGRHLFRVSKAPIKRKRRRRRSAATTESDGTATTHRYRLTTTVVDPDGLLEQEPNNTRKQASTLKPNVVREGYIGWSQDADWYQLDLDGVPPEALLRVDVTSVPNVRLGLRILGKARRDDPRRRGLVVVPESGVLWLSGRSATVRDVGINPDNLPYYVVVAPTQKGAGNPHRRYKIKLTALPPETPHESEPNWRPSQSNLLTPDNPMDGFIGHPTDWDVYRIESKTRMVATVVVSGIPGVDLELEHIDSMRKSRGIANEGTTAEPETYVLIPVGPAPAYVRVRSRQHSFNVDSGYRIAVTLEDASDREIEPNNSFSGGDRVVLGLGKPFRGHIHPRADSDYYAFDVTASTPDESRILNIKLTGVSGLTLRVELFDSQQQLITQRNGVRSGQTKTLTHSFTPGRYYVRVREETGQSANGKETYTVTITE
jgi:hypothetical protein